MVTSSSTADRVGARRVFLAGVAALGYVVAIGVAWVARRVRTT
jgi:hypothetical protein